MSAVASQIYADLDRLPQQQVAVQENWQRRCRQRAGQTELLKEQPVGISYPARADQAYLASLRYPSRNVAEAIGVIGLVADEPALQGDVLQPVGEGEPRSPPRCRRSATSASCMSARRWEWQSP